MRCMSWVWPCRWVRIFSRTSPETPWFRFLFPGSMEPGPKDGNSRKNCLRSITGWGLTYPFEKYESVGMIIPNMWKNKKCSKPPARLLFLFSLRLQYHSDGLLKPLSQGRIQRTHGEFLRCHLKKWHTWQRHGRWLENPTNQWKFGWELHENWGFSSHAWWRVTRWYHW